MVLFSVLLEPLRTSSRTSGYELMIFVMLSNTGMFQKIKASSRTERFYLKENLTFETLKNVFMPTFVLYLL